MVSLSADVDAILDAGVPDPKAIPVEPSKDTMLVALFQTTAVQPPPPRDHAKRHRTREDDESHSRKREHTKLEVARRASFMDEEARQMMAHELAVGESSSKIVDVERSTTEANDIVEYTTDGVPTTEGVIFGKLDPTAY